MKKIAPTLLLSLLISSGISYSAMIPSAEAFTDTTSGFSFDNRLVDATEQNNAFIVEAALMQGMDPNSTGKFETTALHRAAYNGNKEILDILIQKGADVNIRDYGGATPLHFSARQGQVPVSQELVVKGADINAQDDQGYTPLHRAVSNNETSVSLMLISAGADVNTVNNEGNSPLIDAIRVSNPTLVKQLIVKGADRNIRNNKGMDAIDYALKASNSSIDSILATPTDQLMRQGNGVSKNVVAEDSPFNETPASIPAFLKSEAEIQNHPAKPASLNKSPAFANEVEGDQFVDSIKVPTAKVVIEDMGSDTSKAVAKNSPMDIAALEDNSGLQRSKRLPSSGDLPNSLKVQYQKADAAQSAQPQKIVQITKTRNLPVSRLPWAEVPSDSINITGNNSDADMSIEEYVNSVPAPEYKLPEDNKYEYAQNPSNIGNDSGMALPASMQKKSSAQAQNMAAPISQVQTQQIQTMPPIPANAQTLPVIPDTKAATLPVSGLQVIPKTLPVSENYSSPAVQQGTPSMPPAPINSRSAARDMPLSQFATQPAQNYDQQVDEFMDDAVNSATIDKKYASEVDKLMDQAVSGSDIQSNPSSNDVTGQASKNNYIPQNIASENKQNIQPSQSTSADFSALPASLRMRSYNFSPKVTNYATSIAPTNYSQEAEYVATVDTVAKAPVTSVTEIPAPMPQVSPTGDGYNSFRENLKQNINEFYNNPNSQNYTNYDMSNLEKERTNTLGIEANKYNSIPNNSIPAELNNPAYIKTPVPASLGIKGSSYNNSSNLPDTVAKTSPASVETLPMETLKPASSNVASAPKASNQANTSPSAGVSSDDGELREIFLKNLPEEHGGQ